MNSKTESHQLQTESPIQQYYFRALICFAASGTLASFINWDHPSPVHMGMIIFLLAYAYGTYHFTRKQIPELMSRISRWLSHVDAALIGVVLSQ